jgi:hypothetical protein
MTDQTAPRRPRRSKRTIQREKARKAQRDRAREIRAAIKALCRPSPGYTGNVKTDLAHERHRRRLRWLQEAGMQLMLGHDSDQARLVEQYMRDQEAILADRARRAQIAGDPLNLTGHTRKLSAKEQKRRAEKERVARGDRRIVITDPDRPNQNVVVTARPHALRRVKLQLHQEPAAERFISDWEKAGYTGLSSMGFDPKVDSSSQGGGDHLHAASAQARLKAVEKEIGERNYEICLAVLVFGQSATSIHRAGGRDHRSVSHDIDVALNALSNVYAPERQSRDPTWLALQRIIAGARQVVAGMQNEVE